MFNKYIKKQKESFMQGILALMFSQILIKLLGLIYKLYLTNKEGFGDTGNAIYNAGFQIYALLLTISSIGVPNAVSKLISEKTSIGDHKSANKIFKISLATFGIIGFISSILLIFTSKYIANNLIEIPEAEFTLIALAPSIFFVSIISVFRGYFNGRSNIKITANSQSLEQLFKTIFTIIIVEVIYIFNSNNITIMAAGANFATTLATITSLIYLHKYYKIQKKEINIEIKTSINVKRRKNMGVVKDILIVSIPMSLSSILTSINKNIDSFTVVKLLKKVLTESEAKIQYGILSGKADTLSTLPLSFNIAFATALVPTIASAMAKGDWKTIEKRISFSLLITILIGLPCTLGIIIFAKPILNLLFPNTTAGTLILQLSALSIIFTAIEQTVNGALQGIGKIFVPAKALSIGVIVKLILNYILIPNQGNLGGAAGAAISTSICHLIAVSIGFFALIKNVKLNLRPNKYIIKPILATIMMGISSYAIYSISTSIIIEKVATILAIISAIIIYILSIILLNIFSKEEILMLPYGQKVLKFMEKIGIIKNLESL